VDSLPSGQQFIVLVPVLQLSAAYFEAFLAEAQGFVKPHRAEIIGEYFEFDLFDTGIARSRS
jgi:hypothetical protein